MASRTAFLPKVRLAMSIAFKDGALAAFLVVENKRDGNAGGIGPLAVMRLWAEALKVPWKLVLRVDVDHCA